METGAIPRRSAFRAQEVCEIAQVQPYVLSSWEAEFPELGSAKHAEGARVYRRSDVELVLRIKQLVFGEGLTIAGARRRLTEEGLVAASEVPAGDDETGVDLDDDEVLDAATRRNLRNVRSGLEWILGVLGGDVAAGAVVGGRSSSARGRLKKPPKSAKVGRARSGRQRAAIRRGAVAKSKRPRPRGKKKKR